MFSCNFNLTYDYHYHYYKVYGVEFYCSNYVTGQYLTNIVFEKFLGNHINENKPIRKMFLLFWINYIRWNDCGAWIHNRQLSEDCVLINWWAAADLVNNLFFQFIFIAIIYFFLFLFSKIIIKTESLGFISMTLRISRKMSWRMLDSGFPKNFLTV